MQKGVESTRLTKYTDDVEMTLLLAEQLELGFLLHMKLY